MATPTTVTRVTIRKGEPGIRDTLRIMGRLVKQYQADPMIRSLSADLVRHFPNKSFSAEVTALFYYVRDVIRYVKDPVQYELVQTPIKTLELRYGDCDDQVTLLCSMLESIGHPTRFVAVQVDDQPNYSHVFCQTLVGTRWLSLETTERWEPGQQSPRITGRPIVWYPR